MWVSNVSIFPDIFQAIRYGITGRALDSGLLQLHAVNPRDYAGNLQGRIDDRPFGGGPGMVMAYPPLKAAINAAKKAAENAGASTVPRVIFLSPQGRQLKQADVAALSKRSHHIVVSGRYEGIDQRVIDTQIDESWSIGDYVLSGGELASMVLIDAMVRLLPGALGHPVSAAQDSFSYKTEPLTGLSGFDVLSPGTGGLLDYPHYTRPQSVDGCAVPDVLLSGDHARIAKWRHQAALQQTKRHRPDLLCHYPLTSDEEIMLNSFFSDTDTVTVVPVSDD